MNFFFYLIKCLVSLLGRDLLSKLGVCISSVDGTDCLGLKRASRNTSVILSIMRNHEESTQSLQEQFGYENVELSLSQDMGWKEPTWASHQSYTYSGWTNAWAPPGNSMTVFFTSGGQDWRSGLSSESTSDWAAPKAPIFLDYSSVTVKKPGTKTTDLPRAYEPSTKPQQPSYQWSLTTHYWASYLQRPNGLSV